MSDPSAKPRKKNSDRLIGEVIAGRYEIEGRLGKGGMAVVYKAQDRNFGRDVAIKVLRTDVAKDPIAAKRLTREARAAGQLHHPNIITMHDVGTADGMVYIVMEVLVGKELSDLMEEVGAINVPRSLDIARQVASGLAVAHRAGIIHRDIKPENLFLIDTESGADYIKMLDFSIAKLPSAMVTAALTRAGSVFGTPHYMAPEQVEGRTVCTQTDLYALGAVLYECIAGEPPFDGDSVIDILLQHARAQPPKLNALGIWLPEGLSELVDSLLAKKESDRPESATVVEHMLERMMEEARRAPIEVPPTEVRSQVSDADIAAFTKDGQSGSPSAPPPTGPPPGSDPGSPPTLPGGYGAAPADLPGAPNDLPSNFGAGAPADLPGAAGLDLPGGSPVASATLLGAGLADQVNEALAKREALRTKAGAAMAGIAPPPALPADVSGASSVSAPSSIIIRPPPESRARMQSKLRRETQLVDNSTGADENSPAKKAAPNRQNGQDSTMTRRDLKPAAPSVRAPQAAPATVQSVATSSQPKSSQPKSSRRQSARHGESTSSRRPSTSQQRSGIDAAPNDTSTGSSLKTALIAAGVATALVVIGIAVYLVVS